MPDRSSTQELDEILAGLRQQTAPQFGQAQDVLGQILGGGGPIVGAFGQLREATLEDLLAVRTGGERNILRRQELGGTGRTGATAALLRGLDVDLGRERAGAIGRLGAQEATLQQQAIQDAIARIFGFQQNLLGADISRARLHADEPREPGVLGTIGGALGDLAPFLSLVPGLGPVVGAGTAAAGGALGRV